MEAAVRRFLQLLDSGESDGDRRRAAVERIQRRVARSHAEAAVSSATVQRLLHHMHLRYNPDEEAASVLTARLERAADAAEVLHSAATHPDAPVQTGEVVWALLDALAAADEATVHQQAELQEASDALGQLRTSITVVLAQILDTGCRAARASRGGDSFPEMVMLSEGLLRPSVVTALLRAGAGWSEATVGGDTLASNACSCDPLLILNRGLCQLQLSRSQPGLEAGPPTFTAAESALHSWPQLLARSLELRLSMQPSGRGIAPRAVQEQQMTALQILSELWLLAGDDTRMVFAGTGALCSAVAACVSDTAANLDVREAAAVMSCRLLRVTVTNCSRQMLATWTGSAFIKGLLASFRGGSIHNGGVAMQVQRTAYPAAASMDFIAFAELDIRQPSSIAAQPGAAASVVSGMRFGLSQQDSSSSNDQGSSQWAAMFVSTL